MNHYALARDGQRFLLNRHVPERRTRGHHTRTIGRYTGHYRYPFSAQKPISMNRTWKPPTGLAGAVPVYCTAKPSSDPPATPERLATTWRGAPNPRGLRARARNRRDPQRRVREP